MSQNPEIGPIRSPEIAVLWWIYKCDSEISEIDQEENLDFEQLRENTKDHITFTTLSRSLDILFDIDGTSTLWKENGRRGYWVKHEARGIGKEIWEETPSPYVYYETVNIHKNLLGEPLDIDNDPNEEPRDIYKNR